MTTSWLIDTNVLIYSYDQSCQFHESSYKILENSISGELTVCISHQNLLEFLAVVTSTKRVKHPLAIHDAIKMITFYQTSFALISPVPETFITFNQLISKYHTFRERIFDIYLVATALDNGIDHICTWNVKDFSKIKEINVSSPSELLSSIKK